MQGSNQTILIVVVILVVAAILLWIFMRQRRSQHLHDRFGDEYDRTVDAHGARGKAEADLLDREKRVSALDIRALTPEERESATREWREVKALFVDSPAEAVLRADRQLATVMKTKGYPMADFDHRYENLTVDYADVARHYREGHALTERQSAGQASTEDLRQAMIHYEALFDELVSDVVSTDRDARPVDAPR